MLKKPLLAFFGFFLLLALTCPVLAYPRDRDRDDRDGPDDRDRPRSGYNLTEEQLETWDKIWSAYQDRVYPLQSQLWDQRLLYKILADQTPVNVEQVKAVIAEMRKFRDQLRVESKKLEEEIKAANLPEFLATHARGGPGAPGAECAFGFGGPKDRPGWGHGYGRGFKGRSQHRGWDRDRDHGRY
ncbi:MAG: periplasmic heavy metal sensor [Deltaproteobacteria bacterium]|nr:periplasmic heavy metal sensor [Deltaproteobacteria bacterium]